MEINTIKSGLAIHCHHDILIEHCYDYDERVRVIKRDKLQNEQETRLRLFKLLPKKAIDELPAEVRKAYAEWRKAYAEWCKAYAEWRKATAEVRKAYAEVRKAYAEWCKAYAEWCKAYAEWCKATAEVRKAYAECRKADQEAWHKKWCGCKEWNGKEIVFKEVK